MYIKLLGENENGFPLDCTVGEVYEIVERDRDRLYYFMDDRYERNYAFNHNGAYPYKGNWQIVDKEGNVI